MKPNIDPRDGDIEDDASSTKRRSLFSLAGSLLVEISLPKLAVAWTLLIGLPDTWLRSEVQLTRTAAKSLTPRSIFPAFDDLSHLVTLRAYGKNASPRARHCCTLFN